MKVPAFVQISEKEGHKFIFDCNYADLLAARARETDFRRRSLLNSILRMCRAKWSLKPSLRVGEILHSGD